MICIACVTPTQLKRFVHERGTFTRCVYCGEEGTAVEPKVFFDYVLERVDENVATEGDLSSWEETSIYDLGSDDINTATIDVVLSEWFNLGDDPYYGDLMAYLPEAYVKNDRGGDRHFYVDDGQLERNIYEDRWDQFLAGIQHSHRFFNTQAREFLESIFGFVSGGDGALKPEVVRELRRGEMLFRARSVNGYDAAKAIKAAPAKQLGPAPKEMAGSQRMTPSGISALYCALDRQTCLSEIRSITGDSVVSGALTPTSSLKLLDLTQLAGAEPPTLTVFDPGYLDGMHLKTFVRSVVKKMSRPRGRNDELSYLSTQVVFEFLRLRFVGQVDGLVFPSVQTGEKGTNVVLFPEVCQISDEQYQPPDETERFIGEVAEVAMPIFKPEDRLAFVAGSLRFHKITAIETHAMEFERIGDMFMSDLDRERFKGYF
jgi:hypothetical protein